MNEAKHAKGPWFLEPSTEPTIKNHIGVGSTEHGELAQVVWRMEDDEFQGRNSPRCEANARLIIAAPELLIVAKDFEEALQEMGLLCECGEADCRTTRLRAAIAKATQA